MRTQCAGRRALPPTKQWTPTVFRARPLKARLPLAPPRRREANYAASRVYLGLFALQPAAPLSRKSHGFARSRGNDLCTP